VGRDAELEQIDRLLSSGARAHGAVLFGEAGVGKTRLVADAVAGRQAAGAAVEWVRATEAARDIPLGSFAHVLQAGDEAHHTDDLLHLALARLQARAGGERPFVLALDDAHLLDDVSVALVHLAVTQSPVRVVMSARTGGPLPPGLVALWKDELVERIDVGPLTPAATEQLVMAALGDGVPASLLDRIWELSRGNALFVRELVTTARERRDQGAETPLTLTGGGLQARLRDLVDERLRLLAPGPRAALEVVAVGEQVPLAAAERMLDPRDVDDLEARGLVEVAEAADVEVLQVVHPLYGEVLAAGLARRRRRAILHQLVAAVEGLDHFDRLRMATWQLESGSTGDADLLLVLAGEALGRLDHALAERLARAAGGADRVDAGLVLAEALAGQGRGGESQAVLDGLQPSEPEAVARVAVERASNLFLRLDRSSDAFAVLSETEAALGGQPALQAECRSVAAQMSMFSFRYDEAGAAAARVLDDPDAPETARVRATPVVVTVWGAQGRLDEALGLLDDRLTAAARRHRRAVPYGEVQLAMARFQALYWWGDAHRLDAYTADDLGLRVDHQPPSLRGIVAGFRGGALLARGRAHEALAALQRSSRALAELDWFAQRPLAEAMRARAAVFACDLSLAADAIAAADAAYAVDPQRGARTLPYIELSRAWMRAAEGAPAEAGDRCVALGTMLEGTAGPVAAEVLHAAVRLGRADAAHPALVRLASQVGGPFVPLAARHAEAAAASDADGLAAVGAGFEEIGADLLAAEAWRAAEALCQRAGRGVPAADARRRADGLIERCGNPCSPAFAPPAPGGQDLTDRELEIATLAARGRTSPEIAEALHLSVRTVDTHLSRVYRKLMIRGRRELAAALGIAGR
jgi:ATP/maltotriose-dependent transcriptional regulator MalT